MKKKIVFFSLLAFLSLCLCAFFTACEETENSSGHLLIHTPAAAPTCISEGNTEYWYCPVCEKYFSDDAETEEIALKDTILARTQHDLHTVEEVPATCIGTGMKSYQTCTVCHKILDDAQQEITDESALILPATGIHVPLHHAETPSSCTALGTNEYWSCQTCTALFADSQCKVSVSIDEIAKTEYGPHALQFVEERPGTCSASGFAAHYSCQTCLSLFADSDGQTAISDRSELILPPDPEKHAPAFCRGYSATCYSTGMIDYWVCENCGNFFNDEQCSSLLSYSDITLPVLPHSMTYHAPVAPDCSHSGQREYWECSYCFNYFSDAEGLQSLYDIYLPADPFTHENITYHERISPTCIADGIEEHYFCNDCGGYFDRSMTQCNYPDLIMPRDNAFHSTVFVAAAEASCQPGIRFDCYRCSHCGQYFSDAAAYIGSEIERSAVEVAATKEHDIVHFPYLSASCTAEGNREYWACSVCEEMFADENGTVRTSKEEVVLAMLPHHIVFRPETDSTCSVNGFSAHYYCNMCFSRFADANGNSPLSEEQVKKPLEHHPYSEKWVYDANGHWHPVTCGCTGVSAEYANHDYTAIYLDEPACIFVGELTFVCKVCSHERTQTITKPLQNHNLQLLEGTPATCTQPGTSSCYYCTICKHNYIQNENGDFVRGEPQEIPALGHDYDWTTIVPASCKSDGEYSGVCLHCNDTVTRITPKLEHAPNYSSYESNSVAHWHACSGCGEAMTDREIHTFSPGQDACLYCNASATENWNRVPYTDSDVFIYELLADDTYRITGIDPAFTGSLIINGIYNGKFVSSISDTALKGNSSVTHISFPASLTYIGDCSNCTNLSSISFEDSIRLEKIVSFAHSKIKKVTFPESVKVIGTKAFYHCELQSYTFPSGLERIEDYAFAIKETYKLPDLNIIIPDSCYYIGNHAFEYVETRYLQMGKNLQYIGDYAFAYNRLSYVHISDSITHLGEGAFAYNSFLSTIYFGKGLKEISARAFAYCGSVEHSTEIIWSSSCNITSIGEEAFYRVFRLHQVVIPATVTKIGARAFDRFPGFMYNSISFASPDGWFAGDTPVQDANKLVEIEYTEGYTQQTGIYSVYADRVWTKKNGY